MRIIHARSLVLLLALTSTLALLPSPGPTTWAATADGEGPLHPKSAAGLMPPACGLDSDAAAPAAAAPAIDVLHDPINTSVGSWAQLVAAADFNNDQVAEAAVGTADYFDQAND